MQWRKLVFSGRPHLRVRRHFIFWLLWLIYIVFTIFFTPEIPGNVFYHHQPGLNELGTLKYGLLVLVKSVLLMFTHMVFCYAFINIFLANYFLKGKYMYLLTGLLLLCAFSIPCSYFLYSLVYPSLDRLFHLHLNEVNRNILWTCISAGLIGSVKVTIAAVAIISLKRWWLRQKEKEQLEREKVNAELQLLKAQIHPAFLFNTLNNIITHVQAASPKAPEMLIKLSELLSYMLYDCDVPEVSLKREISMLTDYMALEKARQGERLEMTIRINGTINEQVISPLILLPFIDNSLWHCNNERLEQAWINLNITIDGNHLSLKIINGLSVPVTGKTADDALRLGNVQKRLQFFYPGRHKLKISAEEELLMVQLNLSLKDAIHKDQTIVELTKPAFSYAGV